jgi:hypothetical protein
MMKREALGSIGLFVGLAAAVALGSCSLGRCRSGLPRMGLADMQRAPTTGGGARLSLGLVSLPSGESRYPV